MEIAHICGAHHSIVFKRPQTPQNNRTCVQGYWQTRPVSKRMTGPHPRVAGGFEPSAWKRSLAFKYLDVNRPDLFEHNQ
ncbi:hypothetical protein [Paraburkholderia sartisoli]|uniref:hypothetical protein n=1 Tax=Paraburkholderia sartisoli TaxID=83784 RepID=UPI0011602B54|nr:hypothetical protein [Paraburkholderia sartisoli]